MSSGVAAAVASVGLMRVFPSRVRVRAEAAGAQRGELGRAGPAGKSEDDFPTAKIPHLTARDNRLRRGANQRRMGRYYQCG